MFPIRGRLIAPHELPGLEPRRRAWRPGRSAPVADSNTATAPPPLGPSKRTPAPALTFDTWAVTDEVGGDIRNQCGASGMTI